MKVLELEVINRFIRMANDGWKQGWHERNGGNLSYRMRKEEVQQIQNEMDLQSEWIKLGISVPKLCGEYFIVTGSGKYFRNISSQAEESIGIIKIDEKGEKYQVVWGLVSGDKPTSELSTHLMNHQVKKIIPDKDYRVIYHAHPANIIALTFVLPLDSYTFTRELWEMITECPLVFPMGIGILPWRIPGGSEIAQETSDLMQKHDVTIWAHHGIFCSGEDFDETFGLMHTVEKAAEILVKVISMNGKKRQTIRLDNIKELARDYNISLAEEFLR